MKPVLFASGLGKSPDRAENMRVLYEAYPGEKVFAAGESVNIEAQSGRYGLMVIDVFPVVSPGKTIMVWHAIQGGKYIGLDQKGTYYRKEYADLIDFIVAAGRGGVEMFHRCTGVPEERILNLGMPRTDRYRSFIRPVKDKRHYLFVPTFRGARDEPMPEIDWHAIDSLLEDDEILMVKPHPYGIPFDIRGCRRIFEVPKMAPSVMYLYEADVVITDYSSIIFDGYLLGKPAVLFEKRKGYAERRGMYMKYPDQYCSRYADNETDLVMLIRSADRLTKVERDCIDYVADMCDGHSCERICRLIMEVNEG